MLGFLLSVRAEEQRPNSGNTVLRHISSSTGRPNAPSMLNIICVYGDGFLQFIFPDNIKWLTYHLYNGTENISGVVSPDNPIAEIPSLHGEYNIECQDDGGRTYVGILYF